MRNMGWISLAIVVLVLLVAQMDRNALGLVDWYDDSTHIAQRFGGNFISGTGFLVSSADAPTDNRVDYTLGVDTSTVVTLTDTQTLTNKTLTSPALSSATLTGTSTSGNIVPGSDDTDWLGSDASGWAGLWFPNYHLLELPATGYQPGFRHNTDGLGTGLVLMPHGTPVGNTKSELWVSMTDWVESVANISSLTIQAGSDCVGSENYVIVPYAKGTGSYYDIEFWGRRQQATAAFQKVLTIASPASGDTYAQFDRDVIFNDTLTISETTLTQNYRFRGVTGDANTLALQGQSSNTNTILAIMSYDGDATDYNGIHIYGKGTPTSITNRERMYWLYLAESKWVLATDAGGTGVNRDFEIQDDETAWMTFTTGAGVEINKGNLLIGTTEDSGSGNSSLVFGDGTALASMAANTAGLYANDSGGTVEMYAIDEAGNSNLLSQHDPDLLNNIPLDREYPYVDYSKNPYLGKEIWVDMLGLAQAVEALTGEQFAFIDDLPISEQRDWYTDQKALKTTADAERQRILAQADRIQAEITQLTHQIATGETTDATLATLEMLQKQASTLVLPSEYICEDPPQWMQDRGVALDKRGCD